MQHSIYLPWKDEWLSEPCGDLSLCVLRSEAFERAAEPAEPTLQQDGLSAEEFNFASRFSSQPRNFPETKQQSIDKSKQVPSSAFPVDQSATKMYVLFVETGQRPQEEAQE